MQIKVTYDKVSGSLSVESDIEDVVPLEIASNATVDTSGSLYFEIAVDTTSYEQSHQDDDLFNPVDIE